MNNNNAPKSYKGKDSNSYPSKTSSHNSKEWGINLGENLSIKGRILPQPKLLYDKHQIVTPNNWNFRSGPTFNGGALNKYNCVYVYDKKDNSDIRNSLRGLLDKGRSKRLNINAGPNDLHIISLSNFSNWEDIKRNFGQIETHSKDLQMTIVFLSPFLEKYYSNLKEYFTNVIKIPTQFVVSKKLQDPKRAGSIMFNIVEQINVKIGGINFYIDFYHDNILSKGKIYLILGLECRKASKGEISFVMTSSTNMNINKMITTVRKCKNNKEDKEKIIGELMQNALNGLRQGRPPTPQIILFLPSGRKLCAK